MIWQTNASRNFFVEDGTGDFVPLAAGILTRTDLFEQSDGEKLCYFDPLGSQVQNTGARRYGVAFSGRRVLGDPAQDRIFAVFEAGGEQQIAYQEQWTGTGGPETCSGVAVIRFQDAGGTADEARMIRFTLIFLEDQV